MRKKTKVIGGLGSVGMLIGMIFLLMLTSTSTGHAPLQVTWDVGGNNFLPAPPATQILGSLSTDDVSIQAGATQGIFVDGGWTGGIPGNVGIGMAFTSVPVPILPTSTLEVDGNVVVGSGYIAGGGAPTDGMIVQGKVGIGQSVPVSTLDVWDYGANAQIARFVAPNGTQNNDIVWIGSGESEDVANLLKIDYGNSYAFNAMTVRTNGNVGIGITGPQANLDIKTDNMYELRFSGDNNSNIYTPDAHMYFLAGENKTLQFGSDGTNSQMVLVKGKVGIAVGNPSRILHISDTANPPLRYDCTTAINKTAQNLYIPIDVNGTTYYLRLYQ